ncbi:MAG: DUF4142 domain-containing protein [Janthinobacterium lividum]
MKRGLLVSSILLAGMLTGCGNSEKSAANSVTKAAATVETTGSPGTIGANGPSLVSTPEFVAKFAESDMYEIAAANIALGKSQSDAIKAFARQMITDHGATSARLKALAATIGVADAPPAFDIRHAKMISDLQKAAPEKFDRRYLDQQLEAHREALGLVDSYSTFGKNAALKSFAAETKPKIQVHLEMASKLDHGAADRK